MRSIIAAGILMTVSPAAAQSASADTIYFKAGATTEDFQRAKAACLGHAEIVESGSLDPNALARAGTWLAVYRTCMRAGGWVLIPKR